VEGVGSKKCKYDNLAIKDFLYILETAVYGQALPFREFLYRRDFSNLNLTEIYHEFKISALINNVADELANDILERKTLIRHQLALKKHKNSKFKRIFSINRYEDNVSAFINDIDELANDDLEETNSRLNHPTYTNLFSKTDYRAAWLLTITQVSVKFFSIVNQFNIFFNGGNLTNSQIQELSIMGTPEMEFIKDLSKLKNQIHDIDDNDVEYLYIEFIKDNMALTKENVMEKAECFLDLAIEFELVPSNKKTEFLEAITSYYNRFKGMDKEIFKKYARKIQAVLNNYFWKEMPTEVLTEKVYKIFHKIRKFLINLDVNGLASSIEGFNKMVYVVSWKLLDGELPVLEKVIDDFLRGTIGQESVWINLEQMRQQLKALLKEKVVTSVQNAGVSLLPTQLNTLEFILTNNDAFKNQMEKIFSILDMILESFDNLKETFYSEGFHCAACNNSLIDFEEGGYVNLGGLIEYFNLWFLIENWRSSTMRGYDFDLRNFKYLRNLAAPNANNLIISLYGNCAANFKKDLSGVNMLKIYLESIC